jgi:hypothetical protein
MEESSLLGAARVYHRLEAGRAKPQWICPVDQDSAVSAINLLSPCVSLDSLTLAD